MHKKEKELRQLTLTFLGSLVNKNIENIMLIQRTKTGVGS